MRLILTRHGETIENREQIHQGHLPGKLTAEGIVQAKKLALRLKNEKIDCIYSSDLARCADTAKEITRYHPDVPIHFVQALREQDHGSITGKKKSEVSHSCEPPDIENAESMQARAKTLLDHAYERYPKGTVVFVGHGGINRVLLTIITHRPASEFRKFENPSHASVSIFDIREDKNHIVHLLNDTRHLE